MACCILTAFIMNQLIKACDTLDIRFLQIKYNDDEGDACAPADAHNNTSETCRITISGMTCSACSSSLTQQLESSSGIYRASVSLALGRATISYDTLKITPPEIVGIVRQAGYDTALGEKSLNDAIERLRQSQELQDLRSAITSASVCSTMIIGLENLTHLSKFSRDPSRSQLVVALISLLLAYRAQITDAWSIHSRAWSGRGKQNATMETLISLSLLCGFLLSMLQILRPNSSRDIAYASSGSLLTVVVLAGRYLEAVLKREDNSKLAALYELQTAKETYQVTSNSVRGSLNTSSVALIIKADRDGSVIAKKRG